MKILRVHNFYQQFGGENIIALQEKERLEKTDDVLFYSRHNDEIRDYSSLQKATFFSNTIHSRITPPKCGGISTSSSLISHMSTTSIPSSRRPCTTPYTPVVFLSCR